MPCPTDPGVAVGNPGSPNVAQPWHPLGKIQSKAYPQAQGPQQGRLQQSIRSKARTGQHLARQGPEHVFLSKGYITASFRVDEIAPRSSGTELMQQDISGILNQTTSARVECASNQCIPPRNLTMFLSCLIAWTSSVNKGGPQGPFARDSPTSGYSLGWLPISSGRTNKQLSLSGNLTKP